MAKKFFDVDQQPVPPEPPEKPEKVKPIRRRRRYAHKFSAGRTRKLVRGANGQNRWRKVPDGAIVFFGKRQLYFKNKEE